MGKRNSPEKVGSDQDKTREMVIKKYYLEFPELEGAPVFPIEDSLDIGSQSGEACIDRPEISPSHCAIHLNQGVFSVIDHGSESGTFVNGERVPANRMIILDDSDRLMAGNIKFKIVERMEEKPLADTLTEDEEETPPDFLAPEDATQEISVDKIFAQEKNSTDSESRPPKEPLREATAKEPQREATANEPPPFVLKAQKAQKNNQKDKKTKEDKKKESPFKVDQAKAESLDASNGFLRAMGLLADALIVGIIHVLASNQAAYRAFFNDLPNLAKSVVGPVYEEYLAPVLAMAFEALPILEKAQSFALSLVEDQYLVVAPFALLLGVFRLTSSLIFGASLGQCLVGIRAKGSFLLKRVLAPLRWTLGALFLPVFWLADFPALFSKRSLKEVLSFTRLETPSVFAAAFSCLLVLPLLSAGFLAAPVLRDFDFPQAVSFTGMEKVELGVFDSSLIDSRSEYFELGIPGEKTLYFLPLFHFSSKGGRKLLNPSFLAAQAENELVEVKKLKQVSLVDLFSDFVRSNPLAELKYPELSGLARDVSNTNKNFKDASFPEAAVAKDVQKLLGQTLSLSLQDPAGLAGFVKENGPFLGAFLDFRKRLSGLLGEGAKAFEVRQIGDSIHIVGDYSNGRKTIKRMLPLVGKSSNIYQISHSKDFEGSLPHFISWKSAEGFGTDADPLVAFVDSFDPGVSKENIFQVYQAASQAYFELGKTSLLKGDELLYRHLTRSLESALAALENAPALGIPEKAADKIIQNLNDLLKALNDRDLEYFGASAVGAVL